MENNKEKTLMVYIECFGSGDNIFKCQTKIENYHNFIQWLKKQYAKLHLVQTTIMKIELISEEIFLNIVNYAYPKTVGTIKVKFDKDNDDIILQFIDKGVPYNPLDKEDPDITLDANQRDIGGLGILMVKKSAKSVYYEYSEDNENILTVVI